MLTGKSSQQVPETLHTNPPSDLSSAKNINLQKMQNWKVMIKPNPFALGVIVSLVGMD